MRSTLTVRRPEDLADALGRAARESGVAKGDIVRQAVTASDQGCRSVGDVAPLWLDARPADFSTNKAYRRAWAKKRR
jgi:hypothetical protein